jgi:hypothetical protein
LSNLRQSNDKAAFRSHLALAKPIFNFLKMKNSYLLLCALVCAHFSFAQNFQYANVKVVSVSFTGNNLNIKKDDGSGSYTKPQWTAAAIDKSPVAYASGEAPKVSASFTFQCSNAPAFVYLRGEASDSMLFPSQKVTLTNSSTNLYKLEYQESTGSHIFTQGIVRFFKPFVINWEISFDNGVNWRTIGETKNTLYVTYKTPQTEAGEFGWFHTVYDLSCRNAQHQSTEKEIIAGIWTEFTDQIVLNYKDDSLFYYKNLSTPNVTLATLLKYRDAECYTFAQLFLAAIKIQGIVRTNNYVYLEPKATNVCNGKSVDRFLVKNWSFVTATSNPPCSAFPYGTSGIKKLPGIPGSCTKSPASHFGNHQIAKIDGVYYDPSYGATFSNLSELKTKSLSAWGLMVFANSTVNLYFTKDLSVCEMGETISTY